MNLIYVADPMCSWCYGFAGPMDALLAEPGEAAPLQLAIVVGGLRPFTAEPLSPDKADEIFDHWRHVAQASGQPFVAHDDAALRRPGFVYDTEPACRAVVAVRTHWPQHVWRYFKAIQHAFYAQGVDVTRPEALADLAQQIGLPRAEFAQAFASQQARDATLADFSQAQRWGIRGFPTLVAEHDERLHLVGSGYMPIGPLRERLAAVAAQREARATP